ncbi:MAG: haloacid dehalogenase type II [Sphingomonas sp.]|jgi:2-haloacid dehalogenase
MPDFAQLSSTRRSFLGAAAAGAGAAILPGISRAQEPAGRRVDAIAFDGFVIFDPRPVNAMVKAAFPEHGDALAQAWSAKLFGYSWLYTAAGQYTPFAEIADGALRFAAETLGLSLTGAVRARLVESYAQLNAWPDVKPALARLRAAGVRLAFLSNLSEPTLRANMDRAGISAEFDHILSTDRVRQFKPSPAAYGMAPAAFALPKSRIGFAAFGGWDAAGAAWYGYRTAWINRFGVVSEKIEPGPAIAGPGMDAVLMLAGLA